MVINFELVETATPKALDFDNPVQTKCSSGYSMLTRTPELRRSSTYSHTPQLSSFGASG